MVIETLFAGRNNTFSLQLVRGGEPVNLLAITSYSLHLSNGRVFDDQARFTEKANGVIEVSIGDLLAQDDVGSHKAHIVTTDPINTAGVRWPDFKLKVRA
ncbi:hypothetical protein [Giesbergeria anulus]|uniref:Uncharacterized protein n=1 Tax=Giesbergeria anulus TaxID=180197 RepID=A0A1H9E4Z5_9BURK|nr:hypothetical protein [Giesbergeria anulus]SEQ20313.1 hypothetical protein SAMN02982919_00192 [Giesbergeria anulus]